MRISTHPFTCIHIINTDLSTCISAWTIHLYILAILICRLVDLSTCRPSVTVSNKDPVRVKVRVRVSVGLMLGLG